MASAEKKRRVDNIDCKTHPFSNFPKDISRELVVALQKIVNSVEFADITPLKILNCNGADGSRGIPFSKAYICTVAESENCFAFSDLFDKGLDILMTFIEKNEVPEKAQEKFVLSKLLDYIQTKDRELQIENLESLSETELTTLLANHLFGKLATSSEYIIDKHCTGKTRRKKCVCGREDCMLSGNFGDTSIGHEKVWHGKLDIIVNNELVIGAVEKEDSTGSPGGKSPVEVKLKSADLIRNPQIIAETIVFSFLQKKRHPENENFLIPCIGVGHSDMVIMFYDSQHDVLLESSPIPLLQPPNSEDSSPHISLEVIVICWLVVNYKYLCSGLSHIMKGYTADFISLAKEKIEVYEKELKWGNVGLSLTLENLSSKGRRLRTKKGSEIGKKITEIYYTLHQKD